MNNSDQPTPEQASKPPERPHDTAGMMLKKARESANLTHVAVGEALHLTVHYIKALENDDYGKLPGATFIKGYLRAYARYLKLDVNAVLAIYEKNNASAEELSNRTQLSSRNQRRHDQTFRWAVVTAVIVVIGVAAGWWFVGKDQAVTAALTDTQQNVSQPEARSPANNPTTVRAPVQTSAAQVTNTASTAFPSVTPVMSGGTTSAVTQPAGTVGAATQQGLSVTGLQAPANTTGFTPTSVSATSTDMTVTDSTSVTTLNAVASIEQPIAVALTGAEIPQAAVAETINPSVQPASATEASLVATPEGNVALTITPTAEGARQVTLISDGADMLQLYFKGSSWVEIDDGAKGRLYNETLNSGDAMTLHGTAPFKVLLGDAAQVELSFNSVPINLASQIRSDKTARFSLGVADVLPTSTSTSQSVNP
ncbi:MAG: RodZ domain-containing protein [Pseudomonadota bacterium]